MFLRKANWKKKWYIGISDTPHCMYSFEYYKRKIIQEIDQRGKNLINVYTFLMTQRPFFDHTTFGILDAIHDHKSIGVNFFNFPV